jgi:hypothetical protein
MRSIDQVLGDPFYDLLEASVAEARVSVHLLPRLLASDRGAVEALALSRQRSEQLGAQIAARLAQTIMASLRKEDIQAMSGALGRIPESVERFAQRWSIARDQLGEMNLAGLLVLAGKEAETLVGMVGQLRVYDNMSRIRELDAQLQQWDHEADQLIEEVLRRIYAHPGDAVKLVMAQDLVGHLQTILDRCGDAARQVSNIMLKYF